MSNLLVLPLLACVVGLAQEPAPTPLQAPDVMLVAVSRIESMLSGGIGSDKWTGRGTVVVEPLARLTSSGEWKSLSCTIGTERDCRNFEREYLRKPHSYIVVSSDGRGASVHAAPTSLSECHDFSGRGTYSGANLARSAIAASSNEFFTDSIPPRHLGDEERAAALTALHALIPRGLDSVQDLRLLAVRLEEHDMLVIERAFADIPSKRTGQEKFIFAIGTISQGRFEVLQWKQNTEDEEERVLGSIRLLSGREFLITVVSDPESHSYRVYGIRGGRLTLVYSGGGSGC
jgi:hypothetical protein